MTKKHRMLKTRDVDRDPKALADKMIESLEKEFELTFLINEARVLKNKTGDNRRAMRVVEKILKLDPDNRDGLLLKAGILSDLGMSREQNKVLKKILKLYPENHGVYYLIALRAFRMNNDKQALKYIDISLEKAETFDNLMAKAQFLHLIEDNKDYRKYLKKAEKLNKSRFDNYMKHFWVSREEYERIGVESSWLRYHA